jgi:hypothetical protein
MYKGEGSSRVTGCWIDSGGEEGGEDSAVVECPDGLDGIREGEEEGTGVSSMLDLTSDRSA